MSSDDVAGGPAHQPGSEPDGYDPFAGPDPRFEVDAAELVEALIDPKTGGILRRRGQRANAPIFQRVGCFITGTLDLRGAELDYLLRFTNCRFENPPDVREAGLLGLSFYRCWMPGLKARNLRSKYDVRVLNSCVDARSDGGDGTATAGAHMVPPGRDVHTAAVNLTDANVDSSVSLAGSVIRNPGDRAVHADRMQVTGAFLAHLTAVEGEVRMPGLRTGGNANFSGAHLDNPAGAALVADGAHVGGLLICEKRQVAWHTRARSFSTRGSVHLTNAQVNGDVVLRDAHIWVDPDGPGLERRAGLASSRDAERIDPRPSIAADRLRVDGNIECRAMSGNGTVRLLNAAIGGSLRLTAAEITVPRGEAEPFYDRAVHLDGSNISADIQADRLRVEGQLRLADITVGGNLLATGMELKHPGRDVFCAPRSRVGGNINLAGSSIAGTVQMQGIVVGANAELVGTRLTEPAERRFRTYSLDMRTAQIGRDLLLGQADPPGIDAEGGVNLDGVKVTRRINLNATRLRSLPEVRLRVRHGPLEGSQGLALNTAEVTTEAGAHGEHDTQRAPRGIALDATDAVAEEFVLTPQYPPEGRVVLRRARCGTLDDNAQLWEASKGIELEEFQYDALREPIEIEDDGEVKRRLRRLRGAMRDYRPGPYDQLATMLRASGNEEHAATVSMRKQQYRYEALARGAGVFAPGVWLWSWLQRAMVGYGYRPVRALAWLLALLVAGSLWFGLGIDDCVNHPERFQVNGPRCVVNADDTGLEWNPVLHTVDLLVPIVDFGNKGRWHMGGVDKWVATGFTASGWVLATTVAAGVTRALRRP
ncbi:hypothetical protein SAMN06265360_10121 [Haloechinothrix alba]|uniref:Oxidoreductase n=1 Tax=Haloechinothrix alba TaxID=664784 RepID=A0A238UYP0_9PSEU|nr:oxidoreductase [Haloechinothrix alba]SNR27108.1 hypothetical protein SAMN06265360_10121 [Haloechinothrix alba]